MRIALCDEIMNEFDREKPETHHVSYDLVLRINNTNKRPTILIASVTLLLIGELTFAYWHQ